MLRAVAYRPILRILDERAERVRHSLAEAERVKEEAKKNEEDLNLRRQEALQQSQEIVARANQAAERIHQEALAEARRAADEFLARSRAEIDRERQQAIAEIRAPDGRPRPVRGEPGRAALAQPARALPDHRGSAGRGREGQPELARRTRMNGGRVARRYARAAFDLAVSTGQEEAWLRDLRVIESILTQEEVAKLLDNPAVPDAEKREVVERALAGLDQLRRNFVYVLLEHGRTSAISEIIAEFQKELNAYQGIAIAEVTTAVPLDDAESRAVPRRLEQLVGKRIILEKRVDPSILGGVIARIGDRLVDGSIAGQLESLRRELTPS